MGGVDPLALKRGRAARELPAELMVMGAAAGSRRNEVAETREAVGCGGDPAQALDDLRDLVHGRGGEIAAHVVAQIEPVGHAEEDRIDVLEHRGPGNAGHIGGVAQRERRLPKQRLHPPERFGAGTPVVGEGGFAGEDLLGDHRPVEHPAGDLLAERLGKRLRRRAAGLIEPLGDGKTQGLRAEPRLEARGELMVRRRRETEEHNVGARGGLFQEDCFSRRRAADPHRHGMMWAQPVLHGPAHLAVAEDQDLILFSHRQDALDIIKQEIVTADERRY